MSRMLNALQLVLLACMFPMPSFGQEQTVDNFIINFGLLSWEQIRQGPAEKPGSHTEEYHYAMAREMAKMHKGGKKGTYHILVVIDDKKTGKRINEADVRVTFAGRLGPETVELEPMTMDNFAGFGEFVRLKSGSPYVFDVSFRLSEKEPFKQVRFIVQ